MSQFLWNGGLCVMPGTHELPRSKLTGYQTQTLFVALQAAGNSTLMGLKLDCTKQTFSAGIYSDEA